VLAEAVVVAAFDVVAAAAVDAVVVVAELVEAAAVVTARVVDAAVVTAFVVVAAVDVVAAFVVEAVVVACVVVAAVVADAVVLATYDVVLVVDEHDCIDTKITMAVLPELPLGVPNALGQSLNVRTFHLVVEPDFVVTYGLFFPLLVVSVV
jgi:hypothetical protein